MSELNNINLIFGAACGILSLGLWAGVLRVLIDPYADMLDRVLAGCIIASLAVVTSSLSLGFLL